MQDSVFSECFHEFKNYFILINFEIIQNWANNFSDPDKILELLYV